MQLCRLLFCEEERRARQEEWRAQAERERAEAEEGARRVHEERVRQARQQRTKANFLMLETVHQRVVYTRNCRLQLKRKDHQARVLIYAVETEIAERRAHREEKWPKTAGLDKRCPDLAAQLAALKKAYDKAYQGLRYLRDRGKPHGHALLATRRLLREAWMLYLALPAPMRDKEIREA